MDEHDIWGRLPLEEVYRNPAEPLPVDHLAMLSDLLLYCVQVMLAVFPKDLPEIDAPARTEMDHRFTSAFENAAAHLDDQGLVVPTSPVEDGSWYRLAVPRDRLAEHLRASHRQGNLAFDYFNRAL